MDASEVEIMEGEEEMNIKGTFVEGGLFNKSGGCEPLGEFEDSLSVLYLLLIVVAFVFAVVLYLMVIVSVMSWFGFNEDPR